MLSSRSLVLLSCLSAPTVGWAQDEPPRVALFEVIDEGSAAPHRYGWKLDPAAESTQVAGDELELSRFFPCGIALGKTAADHPYDGNCGRLGDGPAFSIYPDGLVAVARKDVANPRPDELADLRMRRIDTLGTDEGALGVPDMFMPRFGDTHPLFGPDACAIDDEDTRGVYFYASELDGGEGAPFMVITWEGMRPAGDCDGPANTFQMIVSALPTPANAGNVRPPAKVEYRYDQCGWSVPDQDLIPPVEPGAPPWMGVVGARAGMLFDSTAGADQPRAIEVLGAKEVAFGVSNNGIIAPERAYGASGDPRRVTDHCETSNLQVPARGGFSFELDVNGLPKADVDYDGVPDGHDNCLGLANPYQANVDGDVNGDACDENADGDFLDNLDDLCPRTSDDNNSDNDDDGEGDICDADDDDDGVMDEVDNCPWVVNPNQDNLDANVPGAEPDLLGDLCDPDMDGDGVPNKIDACMRLSSVTTFIPFVNDFDGDGDIVCDEDDIDAMRAIIYLMVTLNDAGWTPDGPMIEVIEYARMEAKEFGSADVAFILNWSVLTGKSLDELWAVVDDALKWKLAESQRSSLQQAVMDAYATTGSSNLMLFYDWSKSTLGLGDFMAAQGAWSEKGSN